MKLKKHVIKFIYTRRFIYDEKDRLICERTNTNSTYYIYSLDGLLGFIYNNNVYYYIIDIEGKIIGITNQSGFVLARYRYSPYGDIIDTYEDSSISGISHMKYKSYYYDNESSMYYLKSRYYLPEIGRFISPDNIKYINPDDINGYSLYSYCNNNPIMYSDPDGNWILTVAIIALIVGTVIGATVSDIKKITDGTVKASVEGENIKIENSFMIKTPWIQFMYSFYLNHIYSDTKDVIIGGSFGFQFEWMAHNILYELGIMRESTRDADFGPTIYNDKHDGFEFIMFSLYALSNPAFALMDFLFFIIWSRRNEKK